MSKKTAEQMRSDYHFFSDTPTDAEAKLIKLLDFLDDNELYFYTMEDEMRQKVSEINQGKQRYVHVTISIKLS